jgi:radical SAM superfamily enzyme YgiQ (UPF0313 family)
MTNFKITLINPNFRTKLGGDDSISSILPPLGLAYIAAMLRKGGFEDINVIDMNAENLNVQQTFERIRANCPDMIGITASTPTINQVNELVNKIKEENSTLHIILGGAHPTSLPLEVMANKNVDFVAIGESEWIMLELCNTFLTDRPLKDIKGLVWRSLDGKVNINEPMSQIEDLDSLPFPAIDLLPLDKYKSAYSKHEKFANILTSRGCPGRCIYCNKKIFGFDVRMRSAENMVKEIEFLHQTYGYKEFHIVDDLFTQDRQRVVDFCNLIIDKKLDICWKLGNGVRVGSVDLELLKLMKKAGLYSLSFGIESGNQAVLNRMKKGQTLDMCRKAVNAANDAGLFVVGFFMFGNIGEDEQTMRDTIEFAKSLPLDVAQFSILVPFPGTEVRAIIEKEGKILELDYTKYDNIDGKMLFQHGSLTPELVERMHKQAYKEFYGRPSFILRRLLRTRSWLELKNQIKGGMAIFGIGGKK